VTNVVVFIVLGICADLLLFGLGWAT